MEAVAADILGVGGDLAVFGVEVDEGDVILLGEDGDAGIPALDLSAHVCFLRGAEAREVGEQGQVGQVCHDDTSLGALAEALQEGVEVLHVAVVGDVSDKIVGDEPDGDQSGVGGEGDGEFLREGGVEVDAADTEVDGVRAFGEVLR